MRRHLEGDLTIAKDAVDAIFAEQVRAPPRQLGLARWFRVLVGAIVAALNSITRTSDVPAERPT
jgi:hypothetical protein